MYLVWFENSHTDKTTPATIATGPAQLEYCLSNSRPSSSARLRRRYRNWSQNMTASQGAIQ